MLWQQCNLGLGVRWWVRDSYCFKIGLKSLPPPPLFFCNAWMSALGRFVEHSCRISSEIHGMLTWFLEKRMKLWLGMCSLLFGWRTLKGCVGTRPVQLTQTSECEKTMWEQAWCRWHKLQSVRREAAFGCWLCSYHQPKSRSCFVPGGWTKAVLASGEVLLKQIHACFTQALPLRDVF